MLSANLVVFALSVLYRPQLFLISQNICGFVLHKFQINELLAILNEIH